jgi:septum formation protein
MIHNILNNKQIVLASASPRRVYLLKQIGINFIQYPANIDETIHPSDNVNPKRYVHKTAHKKNSFVKKQMDEDCVVIAADTIVYLNGTILSKPINSQEAFSFLTQLSNNTHTIYTGLSISYKDVTLTEIEKTHVKFCTLTDDEIDSYIETKEVFDKAGAYGIQGYGSQFIEKINGCYYNVMGFPIRLFYEMIKKIVV